MNPQLNSPRSEKENTGLKTGSCYSTLSLRHHFKTFLWSELFNEREFAILQMSPQWYLHTAFNDASFKRQAKTYLVDNIHITLLC